MNRLSGLSEESVRASNTWRCLIDMRKNNDYYFDKYVEVTCKDSWKEGWNEGLNEGWKEGLNEVASEMMAKLDAAIEEEGLSPELATKLREAICFAD